MNATPARSTAARSSPAGDPPSPPETPTLLDGAADSRAANTQHDPGARAAIVAPPNMGRRDTRRALASLDMTAVIVVLDNGGGGLLAKLVATGDPDAQLRLFRSMNPRVAGLGVVLWADNEVLARRLVAAAREALEQAGHGRAGGWLGVASAMQAEAALRRAAAAAGAQLWTDAERLRMAAEAMR